MHTKNCALTQKRTGATSISIWREVQSSNSAGVKQTISPVSVTVQTDGGTITLSVNDIVQTVTLNTSGGGGGHTYTGGTSFVSTVGITDGGTGVGGHYTRSGATTITANLVLKSRQVTKVPRGEPHPFWGAGNKIVPPLSLYQGPLSPRFMPQGD